MNDPLVVIPLATAERWLEYCEVIIAFSDGTARRDATRLYRGLEFVIQIAKAETTKRCPPHYCDNQGYCHYCGIVMEPSWNEQAEPGK